MELKKQKIIHLSLAPLQYDARVSRATAAGDIVFDRSTALAPGSGLPDHPMTLTRKLHSGLGFGFLSRLGARGSHAAFWSIPFHRHALSQLIASKPDVIHAHDWDALPIAVKAADTLGVPVIYDSHEFASEMHLERSLWRMTMPKAIKNLEGNSIRRCAKVVTVADGIAQLLQGEYALPELPTVVRNLPNYEEMSKVARRRTSNENVLIHYHGILAEGRGIETAVAAMAQLPERFELRLVGPERQRGFLKSIHQMIAELQLAQRISVENAVAPSDLIGLTAQADIGLCMLDNSTRHNRYALPNKIFEYVMAGLLPVISNGPDMVAVLAEGADGIVVTENDPRQLADKLLNVTNARLQVARKTNLALAKKLCWENERGKLIELYQQVSR